MVFYRSCCYVVLACNTPSTGVDNVYVVGVVHIHRLGYCASVFTDVVLALQCSPTWYSSVHRRGLVL